MKHRGGGSHRAAAPSPLSNPQEMTMQKLTDTTPNTETMDTVELMTQTNIGSDPDEPAAPGWRNAVSRRIVEVTDEDENLIPEFVSLDPLPFAFR